MASKKKGLSIIDLSTNVIIHRAEETHINALAWSPQDRLLASGSVSGQINLWTVEGANVLSINMVSDPINAIAWKPNGTQLAIAHRSKVSVFQVK